MIDGRPILVLVGSLLLALLAFRGIKKKEVVGGKGQAKGSNTLQYYLILAGYLFGAIALFLLGMVMLYQDQGIAGPIVLILLFALLYVANAQADKLSKHAANWFKSLFKKKEPPGINPSAHNWALAAVAMISRLKGLDHQSLAGKEHSPLLVKGIQRSLKRDWEIKDKESAEEVINWLMEEGHRKEFHQNIERIQRMDKAALATYMEEVKQGKYEFDSDELKEEELHRIELIDNNTYNIAYLSFMAWDYLRMIDLCRSTFVANYLSDKEAWSIVLSAAQVLQARYDSWAEMGQSFIYAREFWSIVEHRRNGGAYQKAYEDLLNQPDSPWNQMDWSTQLISSP
ncbi:MAG: DUF1266 domain-containing protein [Bacteroidota bacterium]